MSSESANGVTLRSKIKRVIPFNPAMWVLYAAQMRRMVTRAASTAASSKVGPRAIVVLTPWAASPVPWYSLAVGLLLAKRGVDVHFVIDDIEFGTSRFNFRYVLKLINWVAAPLRGTFPVLRLSEQPGSERTGTDHSFRLAGLNATWELRGEMTEKGRAEFIAITQPQIAKSQRHVGPLLDQVKPEFLFVPGGVFGTSGIWFAEAKSRGIRFSSYDAGTSETMIVAVNGIACHLDDIDAAVSRIVAEADAQPVVRDQILEFAQSEIARRHAGTDMFRYQIVDAVQCHERREGAFVMALNSSWDAAALGPHHIFPDSKSWIAHTVATVLRDTDRDIVVRQHPAERFEFGRTTDDYPEFLRAHFGDSPRIQFIGAADPVNSYDLIGQACAVVVHTSTIGIEAAIAGRPVITGSNSYYARLGFVAAPQSLEDYDQALVAAAAGGLIPTSAQRDHALMTYYASQCCNWVRTKFNPGDFGTWRGRSLQEISNYPAVEMLLNAIIDNIPISVLQHKRNFLTKNAS